MQCRRARRRRGAVYARRHALARRRWAESRRRGEAAALDSTSPKAPIKGVRTTWQQWKKQLLRHLGEPQWASCDAGQRLSEGRSTWPDPGNACGGAGETGTVAQRGLRVSHGRRRAWGGWGCGLEGDAAGWYCAVGLHVGVEGAAGFLLLELMGFWLPF